MLCICLVLCYKSILYTHFDWFLLVICWRIDTDDITIDNTDAFLLNKASIFHVAGHYEVFYCILLHVHSVRLNQYYRCRCNHMKRLKFIHVAHYFFLFFLSILAHSPQDIWKINVQSTREGVNLWLSSQELFIWVFMHLHIPFTDFVDFAVLF